MAAGAERRLTTSKAINPSAVLTGVIWSFIVGSLLFRLRSVPDASAQGDPSESLSLSIVGYESVDLALDSHQLRVNRRRQSFSGEPKHVEHAVARYFALVVETRSARDCFTPGRLKQQNDAETFAAPRRPPRWFVRQT
jgi:hypothetical protein